MIVLKLTDTLGSSIQVVLGPGMSIHSSSGSYRSPRAAAILFGRDESCEFEVRETPEEIWAALDDYSSHPPSEVTLVDVAARTANRAKRAGFSATLGKGVEAEAQAAAESEGTP